MNIAYVTAIISVLLLLVFAALSFIKSKDLRFQLIYIAVASFNIGIIVSIILINYSSKSALIWPGLFLVHVGSKIMEVMKELKKD
jgi:hypothetical protein